MQSASWFESPESSSDERVPKEHRKVVSRRPLPAPPPLDDELISSALEEMQSGEALGVDLPERPSRQAPHFSVNAVTQPPQASSALAQAPIPEALKDEVPDLVEEDGSEVPEATLEATPADLDITDPGLPGFAERIAHLPVPVPEMDPEPVAAPEPAPEAELSEVPSDVIPEEFRIAPTFEPARSVEESPYSAPIAPPPSERRSSRFLDIEQAEPPVGSEAVEAAWFSDLGAAPPAVADEGPAWTRDTEAREASLADTVVRPAEDHFELPTPEMPEAEEVAAAVADAETGTAPEPLAEWVADAVASATGDSQATPSATPSDIRTTNPMIDVFSRSAVFDGPRPETDPNDSALGPALDSAPPAEASPRKVVRARVASIGARALAWLVDGVLLCTTTAGLGYAAAQVAGSDLGPLSVMRDPLVAAGLLGLTAVVGAVYAAVGALVGGQTFGARVARVRVLDRSGRCPGLSRALLRGVTASLGTLFFLVGLVWVVVDDRGQALHDKIAQTYVVRA